MKRLKILFLIIALSATAVSAQSYQTALATNLNVSDSFVNFTTSSSVCVNIYAFDGFGQMQLCCAASLAGGKTYYLSARNDVLSNTLTGATPTSLDFRIVTTTAGTCNAAIPSTLTSGMTARLSPVAGFGGTPFQTPSLSSADQNTFAMLCLNIVANGSGFGICRQPKLATTTALLAPACAQQTCIPPQAILPLPVTTACGAGYVCSLPQPL